MIKQLNWVHAFLVLFKTNSNSIQENCFILSLLHIELKKYQTDWTIFPPVGPIMLWTKYKTLLKPFGTPWKIDLQCKLLNFKSTPISYEAAFWRFFSSCTSYDQLHEQVIWLKSVEILTISVSTDQIFVGVINGYY